MHEIITGYGLILTKGKELNILSLLCKKTLPIIPPKLLTTYFLYCLVLFECF